MVYHILENYWQFDLSKLDAVAWSLFNSDCLRRKSTIVTMVLSKTRAMSCMSPAANT